MKSKSKKNHTGSAVDRVTKGRVSQRETSLGFEKYASGMQSSQNDPQGNQDREKPNSDPVVIEPPSIRKRQKWSPEDYQNVLRAFFIAQLNPTKQLQQQTFDEWRRIVGPDFRTYLDSNKLATVRRDIFKNKRLNDTQIDLSLIHISEPTRPY